MGALSSCSVSNYPQSYVPQQTSDITYQQFYDDLSPYGDWVNYQNYGYVWVPDETGFRPYYNNGRWMYTDYGWTWVSNYNWGWAPFHYGRWLYDNFYGWMWVPGYQWAPAWVSWRSSGDYYGWAPLGPGMDINANYGYSNYGFNIPYNNWSFVPRRYINSPRINNYYVDRSQNINIINNTTIINNTRIINNNNRYITGPSTSDVERSTHEKITPVKIVQRGNPGDANVSGNRLTMYKPAIKEVPQQTNNIKPAKISDLNNVKLRHQQMLEENNSLPAKDKELNSSNTQKNNTPLLNNQNTLANPATIKKENQLLNNEKLNREKENQQNIQQNNTLQNEKLNRQNPQQVQQNENNLPVQKPLLNREEINKNNQLNNRHFPTPENNQLPPVKNNPPTKARNFNQPNNAPVNKPMLKQQPVNENSRNNNNNVRSFQRNQPVNKNVQNNQPPRMNENSRVLPPHPSPQKKDKIE